MTTQNGSDPRDVCKACGHLRQYHVRQLKANICLCYMPWRRPEWARLAQLSAIDYATELPLRSKATGSVKEPSSAICNCPGFVASGLRFQPPDNAEEAKLVRLGKMRRTLVEV